MPSNQTVTSPSEVSGSSNDVLGSGGQELVAICISMIHDGIDMTLIAPDGSSVLLINNTGFSFNSNIQFDICFAACSQNADPDPGFSHVFYSSEPWASDGAYTGRYYPSAGCLEDLSGSINGTWTLEMTDCTRRIWVADNSVAYALK